MVQITHQQELFFLGTSIFLILFTFMAGIALSASNNVATGVPLLLACIFTIGLSWLFTHFEWVTFSKNDSQNQAQQPEQSEV